MRKKILFLGAVLMTSCAPKVYVVDRQTVLETEASGDWPQYERGMIKSVMTGLPTDFPGSSDTAKKEKIYNVLNGDVVTSTK